MREPVGCVGDGGWVLVFPCGVHLTLQRCLGLLLVLTKPLPVTANQGFDLRIILVLFFPLLATTLACC